MGHEAVKMAEKLRMVMGVCEGREEWKNSLSSEQSDGLSFRGGAERSRRARRPRIEQEEPHSGPERSVHSGERTTGRPAPSRCQTVGLRHRSPRPDPRKPGRNPPSRVRRMHSMPMGPTEPRWKSSIAHGRTAGPRGTVMAGREGEIQAVLGIGQDHGCPGGVRNSASAFRRSAPPGERC